MLSDRAKGMLIMIAAWQVVPLMDGIAKYLTAYYAVGQIVWARFFTGAEDFSAMRTAPGQ